MSELALRQASLAEKNVLIESLRSQLAEATAEEAVKEAVITVRSGPRCR